MSHQTGKLWGGRFTGDTGLLHSADTPHDAILAIVFYLLFIQIQLWNNSIIRLDMIRLCGGKIS